MTSGQRYKKNPKYTNCRHPCPYCTMRVSKSSDHWCALGTMSNFEKRNLRSGHLIRPGHVTFGVSGSSFFGNVPNCWLNSYGKFGGAMRRRFFTICEKPYGEVEINPPAGARVNPFRFLVGSTKPPLFCIAARTSFPYTENVNPMSPQVQPPGQVK